MKKCCRYDGIGPDILFGGQPFSSGPSGQQQFPAPFHRMQGDFNTVLQRATRRTVMVGFRCRKFLAPGSKLIEQRVIQRPVMGVGNTYRAPDFIQQPAMAAQELSWFLA